MAILVTGGAGYIGSVTVERLRAKGESVVVLDDLERGHGEALAPEIPFYDGEVGNRGLVERIMQEHQIESCIHFAALTYVGESVEKPAMYFVPSGRIQNPVGSINSGKACSAVGQEMT